MSPEVPLKRFLDTLELCLNGALLEAETTMAKDLNIQSLWAYVESEQQENKQFANVLW